MLIKSNVSLFTENNLTPPHLPIHFCPLGHSHFPCFGTWRHLCFPQNPKYYPLFFNTKHTDYLRLPQVFHHASQARFPAMPAVSNWARVPKAPTFQAVGWRGKVITVPTPWGLIVWQLSLATLSFPPPRVFPQTVTPQSFYRELHTTGYLSTISISLRNWSARY